MRWGCVYLYLTVLVVLQANCLFELKVDLGSTSILQCYPCTPSRSRGGSSSPIRRGPVGTGIGGGRRLPATDAEVSVMRSKRYRPLGVPVNPRDRVYHLPARPKQQIQ